MDTVTIPEHARGATFEEVWAILQDVAKRQKETAEQMKATIEAGLYVIEQSGDTMRINVPDGFVPRKW